MRIHSPVLPGEYQPVDEPETAPTPAEPDPDEGYELARDYALED